MDPHLAQGMAAATAPAHGDGKLRLWWQYEHCRFSSFSDIICCLFENTMADD